jgi:hypothetical protein
MPQRATPKTKHYLPSQFIKCEICGQDYYSGYKMKHEGSQRHLWCVEAITKHTQKLEKIIDSLIST